MKTPKRLLRVYDPVAGRYWVDRGYEEFPTQDAAVARWWAARLCIGPYSCALHGGMDGFITNDHITKDTPIPPRLADLINAEIEELNEAARDNAPRYSDVWGWA